MTEEQTHGYSREGEDEHERLDRHWNEMLQELRLAQTGTQILFAFLLSIAFTNRFQDADAFTHDVFVVTLVAAAFAVGLLLAPVAFHRMVFQKQLRDRMIPIAHHLASGGMVFLVVAMCGGVLLAIDAILDRTVALVIVAVVALWFIGFWYVLPTYVRRTSRPTEE
jgi:O-antigen/teichoic acid export membrane protein